MNILIYCYQIKNIHLFASLDVVEYCNWQSQESGLLHFEERISALDYSVLLLDDSFFDFFLILKMVEKFFSNIWIEVWFGLFSGSWGQVGLNPHWGWKCDTTFPQIRPTQTLRYISLLSPFGKFWFLSSKSEPSGIIA